MWTVLARLLIGPLVNAVVSLFTGWLSKKEAQAEGAQAQVSEDNKQAAKVEAAIAQTDAGVDRTQQGIVDAANRGQF